MHIGVGISQNKRGKHVMKNVVDNAYGSHCSGDRKQLAHRYIADLGCAI